MSLWRHFRRLYISLQDLWAMTQEEQPPLQVGIQSNSGGDINIEHSTVNIAAGNIYDHYFERDSKQNKFLDKVESVWIKGVLRCSLDNGEFIELGLHTRPDAVVNVWESTIQESQEFAVALPAGTRILKVFDDAAGELLILGEPGAGKTIMLLDLAQNLLERARKNARFPMPAVFHLSSWAIKRQPLAVWLIQELRKKYHISKKDATSWIKNDGIILLLDGLDEVQHNHRKACIEAINAYRAKHGSAHLAVCSRSSDYQELSTQLLLRCAVVLQSLTKEQIDDHLVHAGDMFAPLLSVLQRTSQLVELVEKPLMLKMLMQIYQDGKVEDLPDFTSKQKRSNDNTYMDDYKHDRNIIEAIRETMRFHTYVNSLSSKIFEEYVHHALHRRGKSDHYTTSQTTHWLSRLAKKMREDEQSILYTDLMGGDWLSTQWSRRLFIGSRFIIWLVFGLLVTLNPVLHFGLSGRFSLGLFWLVSSVIISFTCLLKDNYYEIYRLFRENPIIVKRFLINFLVRNNLSFLIDEDISQFRPLFKDDTSSLIDKAQARYFSKELIEQKRIIREVLARYVPLRIIREIIDPIFRWLKWWLSYEAGELREDISFKDRWRNRLIVSLSLALIFGLLIGFIVGFINSFIFVLTYIILRLIFDSTRYSLLRLLIYWNEDAPLSYSRFLDYAVEHSLLQKVDNGYIFIHQLLLYYFASEDEPKRIIGPFELLWGKHTNL